MREAEPFLFEKKLPANSTDWLDLFASARRYFDLQDAKSPTETPLEARKPELIWTTLKTLYEFLECENIIRGEQFIFEFSLEEDDLTQINEHFLGLLNLWETLSTIYSDRDRADKLLEQVDAFSGKISDLIAIYHPRFKDVSRAEVVEMIAKERDQKKLQGDMRGAFLDALLSHERGRE